MNSPNLSDGFNIKKHSRQYFNSWVRGFTGAFSADTGNILEIVELMNVGKKFKNIIIPAKNVSSLKKMAEHKEMFPMYVDINIATDTKAELATLMKEMNLLDRFTMGVVKSIILNQDSVEEEVAEISEAQKITEESSGIKTVEKVTNHSSNTVRTWDVTDMLQKINFGALMI
jgi:transcription antitermination factor NusG